MVRFRVRLGEVSVRIKFRVTAIKSKLQLSPFTVSHAQMSSKPSEDVPY